MLQIPGCIPLLLSDGDVTQLCLSEGGESYNDVMLNNLVDECKQINLDTHADLTCVNTRRIFYTSEGWVLVITSERKVLSPI
jgi:hypothetical protein